MACEPASFLYFDQHNIIRGFLKRWLPPSPSPLSLWTSCWSWNQIRWWESPPNCCWPAGMRVWEAKHNWSHTVPPSTQITGLPSSSVSTNIGLKWPQNRGYCLADASFKKVWRARFCHAAQLQGCHFKIMTGVTFGRVLCQRAFHSVLLQRFQRNSTDHVVLITLHTLVHSWKNINKRTNDIFSQPICPFQLLVAGDRHRWPLFSCW